MFLLKLESAREDIEAHLQRLAELGKAALGGAICCKSGGGAPIGARAIHVKDVATRSLLSHYSDGLIPATSTSSLYMLHPDTSRNGLR